MVTERTMGPVCWLLGQLLATLRSAVLKGPAWSWGGGESNGEHGDLNAMGWQVVRCGRNGHDHCTAGTPVVEHLERTTVKGGSSALLFASPLQGCPSRWGCRAVMPHDMSCLERVCCALLLALERLIIPRI
ncbi:hypothetical protein TcCL_ESM10014 [Trypanosoma cruzi]|nr:hypothetical protein TcCL_ESM10014 [Trypanosoma cruzi]